MALITGDFSDAYTASKILRLQQSISFLGEIIGLPDFHTALINCLVDLVFTNCTFYTPLGLYKSGQGYPMGGHSSRDALDVDLLCSEIEIITSRNTILKNTLLFLSLIHI